MRLNLLPASVSKAGQTRTAIIGSTLLLLGFIGATAFLMSSSASALQTAKTEAEDAKPAAEAALREANKADEIAAQGVGLQRNVDLADALQTHNLKYTRFYRQILPYIPGYFRLTSMSVRPVNENTCNLNLTGVIQSYQQYADLTLALLRIPGAVTVGRSAFTVHDLKVPSLIETDQIGLPHDVTAERKPPLNNLGPDQQLAYLMAEAQKGSTGFENIGNFGSKDVNQRSSMNKWNEIAISIVMNESGTAPAGEDGGQGGAPPAPAPAPAPGGGVKAPFSFDFRAPNARETLKAGAAAPDAGAGDQAGPR